MFRNCKCSIVDKNSSFLNILSQYLLPIENENFNSILSLDLFHSAEAKFKNVYHIPENSYISDLIYIC